MSSSSLLRIPAAISACIVMGFCILSFIGAIFAVFIVTKIYLSYACIISTPLDNQHIIITKTCDYVDSLEHISSTSSTPIQYGYTLLRESNPVGVFLALLICWMVLFLVVALGIPQVSAAWDLLRATSHTISKNNKATELCLVWTWRHQTLQNIIIVLELIIVTSCSLITIVAHAGTDLTAVQLIMNITVKVLFVRVICAFFVEIYFQELMLVLIIPGSVCEFILPKPIQDKLNKKKKSYATSEQNEKLEKVMENTKPVSV